MKQNDCSRRVGWVEKVKNSLNLSLKAKNVQTAKHDYNNLFRFSTVFPFRVVTYS